jgi:predicted ATPase
VPGAIAAALGLAGATTDPVGAAAEMLSVSPVLPVLDNAEHVTAALRASMRRLLDGAPGVRMLVTSRVRLALPEEHVLALGPLPCRAPDAAAVTLFVERLRRGTGGRDISAAELADAQVVCEKVEGVPLAVELAAVRAAALGTSALVRGLDDVLDLGTSGGAASVRHETLRSVVAWSYELLSAPDRELLDRISIFESDVTLDAVEALAAAGGTTSPAEGLARLVDASLVSALSDGRLVLLDTVRRFARERLALRPWSEDVRVAHAEWVATLLDEVAAGVAGSRDVAAVVRLRRHMDDVRAALRTALASGDRELCERLARSVSTMTVYRPHGELLAWTRRAADELRPAGPAVRSAAARAAYLQGDLDRAKASAAGLDTAVAHHARAVVALYEGAHDHALEAFATAAEAGDVDLACRLDAQAGIALTHCYKGAVDAGRAALDALRLLSESTGAETYGAFADYIAGELALATNEDRVAVELLRAAVVRARAVHADFIVGVASTALLSALVRVGDVDAALGTAVDLIDHWWGNATWTQQWTTLRLASAVLDAAGRPDVALLVLEAAKLDRAAPAVVGDDAAQLDARHARLTQTLGATTAATVAEVATQLPRATVVQRVRQVLTELAAGASGAPATDAVTG